MVLGSDTWLMIEVGVTAVAVAATLALRPGGLVALAALRCPRPAARVAARLQDRVLSRHLERNPPSYVDARARTWRAVGRRQHRLRSHARAPGRPLVRLARRGLALPPRREREHRPQARVKCLATQRTPTTRLHWACPSGSADWPATTRAPPGPFVADQPSPSIVFGKDSSQNCA